MAAGAVARDELHAKALDAAWMDRSSAVAASVSVLNKMEREIFSRAGKECILRRALLRGWICGAGLV